MKDNKPTTAELLQMANEYYKKSYPILSEEPDSEHNRLHRALVTTIWKDGVEAGLEMAKGNKK